MTDRLQVKIICSGRVLSGPSSPPRAAQEGTSLCAHKNIYKTVHSLRPVSKRAHTTVHTKHSQKAGPFSVAPLKMDRPLHNRLAVTGEVPALLAAPLSSIAKCQQP